MELNRKEIMQYIPHRDPFLFLDRAVREGVDKEKLFSSPKEFDIKHSIGHQITAYFHVREDMDMLQGHFPGNPVLPGVIQIEIMAQASCFILATLFKLPLAFKIETSLASVEKAKFKNIVRPGMDLQITSELLQGKGPWTQYKAAISCDGQVMSESQLLAFIKFNEEVK